MCSQETKIQGERRNFHCLEGDRVLSAFLIIDSLSCWGAGKASCSHFIAAEDPIAPESCRHPGFFFFSAI
jgi:hypothetical protein